MYRTSRRSVDTSSHRPRLGIVVLACALAMSACSSDGDTSADDVETVPATWDIQPGVGVLHLTGAEPGQPITLYDDEDRRLLTVKTDEFGQASYPLIPAEHVTVQAGPKTQIASTEGGLLKPGTYTLRDDTASPVIASKPFDVLDVEDVAEPTFYSKQKLQGVPIGILGEIPEGVDIVDGFQYLEMRDGTKLSAMVRFPDPAIYGDGPWPTVIEYSGYGVANPESEEPGVRIARALGYATVSVNMRGTGCSGGVFDVFNLAQMADGYDIVEIVAAQDWVLNGAPGMVGLSYSGITQLYVGATNPPHLAAITPQSVIVDPWLQQWPGGIYNAGFTRRWLEERDRQAAPNGQDWAAKRVESGDKTCADYQTLRNMNVDFEAFGKALEMRPPDADTRDLRLLVKDISAPVYLTGAFQDEQTGAQFAGMINDFDTAQVFKAAIWNGRHPDGYAPSNLIRWFEFLEFYVAKRVPKLNPLVRAGLPAEIGMNFNLNDTEIDPDRFATKYGEDYDAALAAYQAEDPIRVVFESGAGGNEPGEPEGTFERSFETWPPKASEVSTYFATAEGTLTTEEPAVSGTVDFAFDPTAGAESFYKEGGRTGLLDTTWEFDWTRFDAGAAAQFETAPMTEDVILAGPAEANLRIGVTGATDANLQVTLTEVRPDGVEYLLQSGWLRLGHREVNGKLDSLEPERTYQKADYEAITSTEPVTARVSIPSVGAPIRSGSKIRMYVSTPGRDRAEWTFDNPSYATGDESAVKYQLQTGTATGTSLSLTVLTDNQGVPAGLAACPALRGAACRPAK